MTKNSLSIDLRDPRVQDMMGVKPGSLASGKEREVVRIAGDMETGISMTTSLTAGKQEVVVVYGDQFLTVDVYAIPGEPLVAHIICPRCRKQSRIPGDRKAIDFDPSAVNPMRTTILATQSPDLMAAGGIGRLSIEPFECAWEMGDDRHVAGALHSGVSLCRLRIGITNNRAMDA
jgi:hypothetical protein